MAFTIGALLNGMSLLWLAVVAFSIWMLIDAALNVKNRKDKIIWMLVIIFLNAIGAGVYAIFKKKW